MFPSLHYTRPTSMSFFYRLLATPPKHPALLPIDIGNDKRHRRPMFSRFSSCPTATVSQSGNSNRNANVITYKPLEVAVLASRSSHAKRNGAEQDKETDGDRVNQAVQDVADFLGDSLAKMVEQEPEHQDGEVERGVVVVDVSDTAHGNEREEMEDPADEGVDARVVELVNLILAKVVVTALPPDKVNDHRGHKQSQTCGGSPVDERVTQQEVLDDLVVPAAHSQSNVQNGPLPPVRCQIILLVWVRNQGVVGSHHGNVQVEEILQERRFEGLGLGIRELVIPVALDVPVGVLIAGVVLLDASRLNLLETPLGKVDVSGAEVASQNGVFESERRGKRPELALVSARSILDDLNGPMILVVSNGKVSVTRDFVVSLGNGCRDGVRVKVASGLDVNETDDVTISNKAQVLLIRVVVALMAGRVEEPVVVGVLVVVAGNLLLSGALRKRLNVRVQKSSTITHVLDGNTGTNSNLQRAVAQLGTLEVSLEKRAHLGIAGTGVLEDDEMRLKGGHVDKGRNDDEPDDSRNPVRHIDMHRHFQVSELVPQVFNSVKTDHRSCEQSNPLNTADTTNRDTRHHQPEEPLEGERLLLQIVESGKAEHGRESEEKQHGIQQNEAADGGVRVLAQNHQGHEPSTSLRQPELLCRVVRQRNAERSEGGIEDSHEGVVDLRRVFLSGLEFERAIVTGQVSRQTNEYLPQRRVDIEVELSFQIM
jgi:hypothetical protein